MREEEIEHILDQVKVPLEHPSFYTRLYSCVSHDNKSKTNDEISVLIEDFEEFSRFTDKSTLQESCSIRNVWRTRKLAFLLIDDKGDLNRPFLKKAIEHLKKNLYSLGPNRQHDTPRQQHILRVLELLDRDPVYTKLLKSISKPINNEWAETLIRYTLQIDFKIPITDALTRQAVCSAWLCYLRQNVGSCFATAPAECVHDEQGTLFLQDMADLIAKGFLTRIQQGSEHTVPLSRSWGCGDLKKPILFYKKGQEILPEVWTSPSLLAALEGIRLLNSVDPIKQKMDQVKQWILPLIRFEYPSPYMCTTVEELIKKIVFQVYEITEKQLKEWEMRPKEMISSGLVSIQTHQKAGKTLRFEEALSLVDRAKTFFKAYADNALLKAWEFTLASFTESKYEFTTWNLYASLGLQSNAKGGIGECIQHTIQHKLDSANAKIASFQSEAEMIYLQIKTLESRMKSASTEKELSWYRIDYQSKRNEFEFIEEQKERAQQEAAALVNLYETLYKLYVELFKDYFQEVYDAEMQEVLTNPFDDSPAGFRLLYKHGRSHSSAWTAIHNEKEYIEALVGFFVSTEIQIANELADKKIERDLSDVVTAVISHIRSREFIETALERMAAIHGIKTANYPLEKQEANTKKPWVYTSGGCMSSLVKSYFRVSGDVSEAKKWIESESELLTFIIDTVKAVPQDPVKEQYSSLLMQSPTHAFLLKPLYSPFKEFWESEDFTYTHVRDQFILPSEMFVRSILLNDEMIHLLLEQLCEKIPERMIPHFKQVTAFIQGPLNPIFFREQLSDLIEQDDILKFYPQLKTTEIDVLLYASLPLCPEKDLRTRVEKILSLLPNMDPDKMTEALFWLDKTISHKNRYFGAHTLIEICKALVLLLFSNPLASVDFHFKIVEAAQLLGYTLPKPLIFADTNWVKDLFAFVVNPGTGKLELWRLDYTGLNALPMTHWKRWVDGSNKESIWSIFNRPNQYT